MAKFQAKSFAELIKALRKAVDDLESGEAGSLPYCDDPLDGCDEVWRENMKAFKIAAKAISEWPFEPEGDNA